MSLNIKSNSTNHQLINETGPTVLYSNSSGTTGSVTLNQTAANFTFLEVIHSPYSPYHTSFNTSRIYNPNGKYITLIGGSQSSDTSYMQLTTSVYSISGTSMTLNSKVRLFEQNN